MNLSGILYLLAERLSLAVSFWTVTMDEPSTQEAIHQLPPSKPTRDDDTRLSLSIILYYIY